MTYSFHPSHIVHMVKAVIFVLFFGFLTFLLKGILGDFFLPIEGAIFGAGVIYGAIKYAQVQSYTVTLDENELIYTTGIATMKKTVLPFSKVTESNYTQTIIQRIFGLGNLKVDTPGGTEMAVHLKDAAMSDIEMTLNAIKKKQ
ncbi:PH domain-containing protein [Candidatus Micrarchaeota archaeon]|nr:PH domain-containing protein [Candidatus Micrarchaeota archaeon]